MYHEGFDPFCGERGVVGGGRTKGEGEVLSDGVVVGERIPAGCDQSGGEWGWRISLRWA